jgi:hypothetical protein
MKFMKYEVCGECMEAIMLPESPTSVDVGELLAKMIPADHYMLESVEDLGFCARPIVGCDCCHRKLGGNYYEIMSGKV